MIIGLTGKRGAGKDIVADYLVGQYGFVRVAFADPLKESVGALFGITREQIEKWKNDRYVSVSVSVGFELEDGYQIPTAVLSFRKFLQRYGTEAHRQIFGDDFWIDQTFEHIRRLLREGRDVIITDVRFDNEAEVITSVGGTVVEVKRPQNEVADDHASEQLPLADLDIWNDRDFDNLYAEVESILDIVGYLRTKEPADAGE